MVSKLMTWVTYIMKWLHFQIYRTAMWYVLTHSSNRKGSPCMPSFVAILAFVLVKQFLGGLVLSQEKDRMQRTQWATKAPWSLIFAHLPAQFTLGSSWCYPSALRLGEPSHIVPPADNLRGTRFSNPWLWWQEAKKTKGAKWWIHATHVKPPWGKCSLCRPQWSGVKCPAEFSDDGTFQTSALSRTLAPGHMMLLSTWNVVGVTEELNAFFIYV